MLEAALFVFGSYKFRVEEIIEKRGVSHFRLFILAPLMILFPPPRLIRKTKRRKELKNG